MKQEQEVITHIKNDGAAHYSTPGHAVSSNIISGGLHESEQNPILVPMFYMS